MTDHKPLIFAFSNPSKDASPRVVHQLDFIGQFSTDIRHIAGAENIPADVLSRISAVDLPNEIDYDELSKAQANDRELQNLLRDQSGNLVLKQLDVSGNGVLVYCDVSTVKIRPFLSGKFRKIGFNIVHRLAHSGARSTATQVSNRFVWPYMKRDCKEWTRACIACQRAKVTRHTKTPLGEFAESGRFRHIHVDIVGPLPPSDGKQYVVTMMDRATHWPEAVPTNSITAEAVAEILVQSWIARFGSPERISTDQGRQFESELFQQLAKRLGAVKLRTTSYHPQSNGKVERWHRAMKAAIMAYGSEQWTRVLPLILLGLRSAVNTDEGVSAAQLTYGTELRLPGEFFASDESSEREIKNAPDFVRRLSTALRSYANRTRRHGASPVYVPSTLKSCTRVFVRVETQRASLEPPYTGPHQVIDRDEKTITVDMNGRQTKILLDRVKPAFILKQPTVIVEPKPPGAITVVPPRPTLRKMPERRVHFQGPYTK
jgi:cleavage and polyadenylation specificity factor subunit 1